MRALVQRVSSASVTVSGEPVASIGAGLLVLLGVRRGDTAEAADRIARKLLALRVFDDEHGRMNRSVVDVGGEIVCVSQFTLYGDTAARQPAELGGCGAARGGRAAVRAGQGSARRPGRALRRAHGGGARERRPGDAAARELRAGSAGPGMLADLRSVGPLRQGYNRARKDFHLRTGRRPEPHLGVGFAAHLFYAR